MKKTILILLSFLFLFSCSDKKRNHIETLVKEWNNKEILFPEHPVFTRFATDTISYLIPVSDYKIIAFVDSAGCISCKLQLPNWMKFMHEVDSLCGYDIPFIFFFQSKDVRELRYILKRDGFSYPVCIDTEDQFNSLNRFPDEMMFQTFLVDSENRVKVIGNPIHNLSVRELYHRELGGSKIETFPTTDIQTDSVEYLYGTVGKNEMVGKKITLFNAGKEIFRIKGVTTSFDCMTAEYGWDEIQPGDSAIMIVNYKAEESGDFWRTITIYGNIPEKSITLDFLGTVGK